MEEFAKHFRAAKEAGLGVTLHVAEVCKYVMSHEDTNI